MVGRYIQSILWLLIGIVMLVAAWLSFHDGHWQSLEVPKNDATIAIRDSDGHMMDVAYKGVPNRVLVTYPGATELLIDLGLQDKIVGTIAPYGEEPEKYRAIYEKLPILSAPFMPSREEVSDLQPQMIIGWSHHFTPAGLGDVRSWYDRGTLAYVVPATVRRDRPTVESTVYPFIEDMGRIFNVEDRAHTYLESLKTRVEAVTAKSQSMSYHPTVVILQAHGHSTYSLYGPVYMIDDIVEKAGGHNVVDRQMGSIGPERVLAFDPDYIIYVSASQKSGHNLTDEEAKEELVSDDNLKHMRAIQNGKIIVVPFADVNNGNGRVVDALEKIGRSW